MIVCDSSMNDAPSDLAKEVIRQSSHCFWCGDELAYPFVLWVGATGDFVFHPHCAREMGVKLIQESELP